MTIWPQEVVCAFVTPGTLAEAVGEPVLVRVSVQVPPLSITSGRKPVPISFLAELSQLTLCRVTGVTGRVSGAVADGVGDGVLPGVCPAGAEAVGEADGSEGVALGLAVGETLVLGVPDGAPEVQPVTPAITKAPRTANMRVVFETTRTT